MWMIFIHQRDARHLRHIAPLIVDALADTPGHEEGDLLELLARLVTKMRRGLENSHLEDGSHGLQIRDRGIVRARIESDLEGKTDMPVVVIDGRNIPWDEFGRMVATYTGFQFKLELHDLSDEI